MGYLKAFHLLMVMSWIAGIFYLPRIFVHYAEGLRAGEDVRRLKVMARKLYGFMTIMAVLAIGSGLWLWLRYWRDTGHWIHAKLAMVVLLVGFHVHCRMYTGRMQRDAALPGPTALRWFNEAPLLMLVAILWLVVLKPF